MVEEAHSQNVGQIYNSFYHLTKELTPFVAVADLTVCFDYEGNVYIAGEDFREQLDVNFDLPRSIRDGIREIITKHRGCNQPTMSVEVDS